MSRDLLCARCVCACIKTQRGFGAPRVVSSRARARQGPRPRGEPGEEKKDQENKSVLPERSDWRSLFGPDARIFFFVFFCMGLFFGLVGAFLSSAASIEGKEDKKLDRLFFGRHRRRWAKKKKKEWDASIVLWGPGLRAISRVGAIALLQKRTGSPFAHGAFTLPTPTIT
ncbi:hypothetical protein [Pandoravirus japonicus]|uniref:Transmembrane protein n=1 Tax=Pandoravirus japonicus TaxID=2823154 RepID=A0A811BS73_9VIRU|nr:hypothetical protein [Pandoravirus japonicus]